MKAIFSFRLVLFVFCLAILTQGIKAQDDMMKPPLPVKNSTFAMIMGAWKSDPHDMMGTKWTDVATHSMKHNGQYMFVDIVGNDDKGNTYTSTIVVSSDKDGNLTGWGFDVWGGLITYSGTTNGNKISVTGKWGAWGTETRNIEINGDTMVHKVTITVKRPDGKDVSTSESITYHKQ